MSSQHAPEVFVTCDDCCGDGVIRHAIWVYEHGCGFGHDDVSEDTCQACNGIGGFICEAAQ